MSEHFIIMGLPRSMTAWVSCFLTCGDVFCQHELSFVTQGEQLRRQIEQPFPVSGFCDSGALYYWEAVHKLFPGARYAYIDRPGVQVLESIRAASGISFTGATQIVGDMQRMSEDYIRATKPMILSFDELQTKEGAQKLWNHCAPHNPLPPAHLEKMMSLRVVQDPERTRNLVKALAA